MNSNRRTKIVATIGPSSSSAEVIKAMIIAGMDVARLNFSHGSYEDHKKVIGKLRTISDELSKPVTILQDLQGPKIRVANMGGRTVELIKNNTITILPENEYTGAPDSFPIDYPFLAEEAKPGMQVLLADGIFELVVKEINNNKVHCQVIEGGILHERKGVNFPELNLRLPSLTSKDKEDLSFGLSQGIDWISLSFIRSANDIIELRKLLKESGYEKPIIAKIEKPQAIEHLDEIIRGSNGIMVARGDLGVEMSPERVPMLQKRIIEHCNRTGKTVITATQMLESMIHEPRPTRAEASDVANAIIDGTDAIMLSGETAMGSYPVKSVEMMNKIALDVEAKIEFKSYPPADGSSIAALCRATNQIAKVISPACIVVLTASGRSAQSVAAERPGVPVYALTAHSAVYHSLNLLWGIRPILIGDKPDTFEQMVRIVEDNLMMKNLVKSGDQIVFLGGIPAHLRGGTNFVRIHRIS